MRKSAATPNVPEPAPGPADSKSMATKKLITCNATPLNVWVLGRIADGRREFPNAIAAVDAPHMRRCMKAGLVEVVRGRTAKDAMGRNIRHATRLRITEAGRQAIGDQHATDGERIKLIERDYTPEIAS